MQSYVSFIAADTDGDNAAYAVCRFDGESVVVEAAGVAVNDNGGGRLTYARSA